MSERSHRPPGWHRAAFAMAAAPLLFLTLMAWDHEEPLMFGIPALFCVGLAFWPTRLGAAVLFWPFAIGACVFGGVLVKDLVALTQGRPPSVLLDADDSLVFVLLELMLIAVSLLFFVIWKPRDDHPTRPNV